MKDNRLIHAMQPDFEFTDERGSIAQLVHGGYKQVNVIQSAKGAKRGGHYHKMNKEAFYVISGRLMITAEARCERERREFGAGGFFGIDAHVMHSFEFLDDTVLVSMYDKGVELPGGAKDIFTDADY